MASDIDDFSKEQMTKNAMLGLTPFYNNGHTSAQFTQDDNGEALDGTQCAIVLAKKCEAVRKGNLTTLEDTLTSQATTLDCIFNSLARNAAAHLDNKELFEHIATNEDGKKNKGYPHLEAADKLLRLALKAQSQCAKTIETLALIKNPTSIAFVRQANIGQAVQVNNGVPAPSTPAHRENAQSLNPTNELLEVQHGGATLDSRTTSTAIGVNQNMETVGAVNRGKNRRGQSKKLT
jgi:hypothetical protein